MQQPDSELVVEIQAKVLNPYQFGELIIANKQGTPVYLKQVATITDSQAEMETAAYLNGKSAVAIDILRSADANIVDVVKNAYQVIDRIEQQLPAGTTLKVVVDNSESIQSTIKDVARTIVEGRYWQLLLYCCFRFFPLYCHYRFNSADCLAWNTNLYLGIWFYYQYDDSTGTLFKYRLTN